MTNERAKELQENIAKEAVALLVIHEGIDVSAYERCVQLIGKAGALPAEDTLRCLDLIARERSAVGVAEHPQEAEHVLPESELPMNASGLHTLDNVWGLFEAAVQLDDAASRKALYDLARELEETQNLLDWIEKTEEEKLDWMPPEEQVQGSDGQIQSAVAQQ